MRQRRSGEMVEVVDSNALPKELDQTDVPQSRGDLRLYGTERAELDVQIPMVETCYPIFRSLF